VQLSVHERFRLQKQPKLSIWTLTATARFDIPWIMSHDCWHSIDAHFHDGAGSVSLSFLPMKDGNTSIMCIPYQIVFLLPDLQNQKSLPLCWHYVGDGAGSILLSLLHIKVVNAVVMYNHYKITFELPDYRNLQSLMLCWRSFSRWGRECVAFSFAYKGW